MVSDISLKQCRTCLITKPLTDFYRNVRGVGGVQSYCKACGIKANQKYRKTHYDKQLEWNRNSYENNKEKTIERTSLYAKTHKEQTLRYAKTYRVKHPNKVRAAERIYYRANPLPYLLGNAKRRAVKRKAYPKWANPFFISEAYDLARRRTKETGIVWHVDHIVPLQSPVVCGLHVHNNLQVIPGLDNMKKSNIAWPDMP